MNALQVVISREIKSIYTCRISERVCEENRIRDDKSKASEIDKLIQGCKGFLLLYCMDGGSAVRISPWTSHHAQRAGIDFPYWIFDAFDDQFTSGSDGWLESNRTSIFAEQKHMKNSYIFTSNWNHYYAKSQHSKCEMYFEFYFCESIASRSSYEPRIVNSE